MLRRITVLIVVFAGCEPSAISLPESATETNLPAFSHRYDATSTGTVIGTVTWSGESPPAPAFTRRRTLDSSEFVPNPHALMVADGKLQDAFVMLSGIDATRAKPWDHAPVSVELTVDGIIVEQGTARGRVGIVKLGDEVEFKLNSKTILGLRARGAAFFGTMLTPQQTTFRYRFTRPGRVQFASASGLYWASAELIVSDHPYVTTSEAAGHFAFRNVPMGEYTITAWHPNPEVFTREIDPETSVMVRQSYGPAFEVQQPLRVNQISEHLTLQLTPLKR